jgi:2'-5' RNA ligase
MHLTLEFLGDVTAEKAEPLQKALAEHGDHSVPFVLKPGGLGCFPDVKRPRIIWVGLAGDLDVLQRLQSWVSQTSQQYSDHREDRPFQPHLTIGRIQSIKPQEAKALAQGLQDYTIPPGPEWLADHFILVRSFLQPAGASYQTLAEYPLGT